MQYCDVKHPQFSLFFQFFPFKHFRLMSRVLFNAEQLLVALHHSSNTVLGVLRVKYHAIAHPNDAFCVGIKNSISIHSIFKWNFYPVAERVIWTRSCNSGNSLISCVFIQSINTNNTNENPVKTHNKFTTCLTLLLRQRKIVASSENRINSPKSYKLTTNPR